MPHQPESPTRYPRYANVQARTYGHFWQARVCSCPMDMRHCWLALAYVERNPVRAGRSLASESFIDQLEQLRGLPLPQSPEAGRNDRPPSSSALPPRE